MNRSRWSGASPLAAQSAAPFGTLLFPKVVLPQSRTTHELHRLALVVPSKASNDEQPPARALQSLQSIESTPTRETTTPGR
eukprot:4414745-Prymnesium_polylepis.2